MLNQGQESMDAWSSRASIFKKSLISNDVHFGSLLQNSDPCEAGCKQGCVVKFVDVLECGTFFKENELCCHESGVQHSDVLPLHVFTSSPHLCGWLSCTCRLNAYCNWDLADCGGCCRS